MGDPLTGPLMPKVCKGTGCRQKMVYYVHACPDY